MQLPVNCDVVVIGASAGGIEAMTAIAERLPADFPAAIFLVSHLAPHAPSYLPQILSRAGPLRARHAKDGEVFARSQIYVAPPDRHLLVEAGDRLVVRRGPKENGARPAVDPLFRSAALAFGPRVIGVVLSGALDDGTSGLRGIKMCGGTTVVQDPADALVDSMPTVALRHVSVDFCKPARDIGPLLIHLVSQCPEPGSKVEEEMKRQLEMEVATAKSGNGTSVTEFGDPSIFTCPECHGALLQVRGERPLRYRCHTGHAYTADALFAELNDKTDEALWNAMRSVQETAMLAHHLAEHSHGSDEKRELLRRSEEGQEKVALLRKIAGARDD